jgi:D-inositol-3-phosphate glycosyltransferase
VKSIIVGPAYPLRGGIANFNEALCTELIAEGHDCSIVSFSLQYPGFLFPGKTQYADKDQSPNLPIKTILNSINPVSWWITARYIRKHSPEFVIIRYWLPFMGACLGTVARWLKSKEYKPVIIAITDNIIPHEKRIGDNMLTRYFLKSCDGFIVMSQTVMQDLRKFENHKPVILQPHPVYNIFGNKASIDNSKNTLGLDPSFHYVLFFGFIRKYKGLDLLIKAFADNRLHKMGIKLLIAGEFYEDPGPYLELIRKLELEKIIILHDRYIDKDQVKYYFGASEIVAQPYRDATQSGVTQIAYHFEKPMLVTDVGGLSEIVHHGESGYVVPPKPQDITEALVDFFTHQRGPQMIQKVKEAALQFSWNAFIKALEKLVISLK